MLSDYIHYGLLIAPAIALLTAAFTDLRRRQIDNWLNAGDRPDGSLYLVGQRKMDAWPGTLYKSVWRCSHSCCWLVCLPLRVMGGSDVKLLAALALWIQPRCSSSTLLVVMALAGGILTVIMGSWRIVRRRKTTRHTLRVAIAIGERFGFGRTQYPSKVGLLVNSFRIRR
jgi:prepilin peptidase CpaA